MARVFLSTMIYWYRTCSITSWAIWQSAIEYWNQGQHHVLALGVAGFLSGPLVYAIRALVRRLRR